MIEFPCSCGHRFQLPDEEAGGFAQCPKCLRLVDVPTHSDLPGLGDDGTYKVDGEVAPYDAHRIVELAYVYQKGHRDAQGNEIDLRLTDEEIQAVGGDPIPLSPDAPPREQAPKYDPETGELIDPLELKHESSAPPPPSSIPMATATINYASGATARSPSIFQNVSRLLAPGNLAVLLAVLCMHVLLWPVLFITFFGIFFFIVAIPVLGALILAHYGNVIEEAGPFENDELPRPLRNLEFYDDIWSPFCNVFASMILCYAPGVIIFVIALFHPKVAYYAGVLMVAWAAVGTFLFPAVVLTLQAGGTILNLRPDRVMTVIGVTGFNYFAAVVLWVVTVLFYFTGWVGTTLALANLSHDIGAPAFLTSWAVVLPALVIGIVLAHWFCVWLGLIYRAYYEKFPWVLQRHVSTRVRQPPPPGAPQPRRGRSIRRIPQAQRPASGPDV